MRPSRPTTRLIRNRSRLCRSWSATSSLNCSTTSLAGPSRRARRTSKRPRRTCAKPSASSTNRAPSSTEASSPRASSSTTAGVPESARPPPRDRRVAVMTASTYRAFEPDTPRDRPAWAPPKRLQQTARVPLRLERRMRFPPDMQSIRRVRRIIHDVLAELVDRDPAGDVPEFIDDVVLLASELCENAVLHAGTAFELAVVADDDEVTVAVTDRGPGALELHLSEPRQRYGRAATHGRGLSLIARLATTWGTRHDADGRHTVWFALARRPTSAVDQAAAPPPRHERTWSAAEQARWLLHVPTSLVRRLAPADLIREFAARVREAGDR